MKKPCLNCIDNGRFSYPMCREDCKRIETWEKDEQALDEIAEFENEKRKGN
jgi:hypothetical protein